ncbi:MAG: PfkB family carbohydrate kinase, partial [Proteobacteria bacterium]|nr:PfkB family carbohydrate kinase [Pseudomonadota bacterium]
MSTIVTFGEVMLRLSPPGYTRLTQATSLDLKFGGAEANVAVALAQLGLDARFVTVLPDNDLAQACINQ